MKYLKKGVLWNNKKTHDNREVSVMRTTGIITVGVVITYVRSFGKAKVREILRVGVCSTPFEVRPVTLLIQLETHGVIIFSDREHMQAPFSLARHGRIFKCSCICGRAPLSRRFPAGKARQFMPPKSCLRIVAWNQTNIVHCCSRAVVPLISISSIYILLIYLLLSVIMHDFHFYAFTVIQLRFLLSAMISVRELIYYKRLFRLSIQTLDSNSNFKHTRLIVCLLVLLDFIFILLLVKFIVIFIIFNGNFLANTFDCLFTRTT